MFVNPPIKIVMVEPISKGQIHPGGQGICPREGLQRLLFAPGVSMARGLVSKKFERKARRPEQLQAASADTPKKINRFDAGLPVCALAVPAI